MNYETLDAGMTCAGCGGINLRRRTETDEFEYGAGEDAVILSGNVVVFSCRDCELEFTGPSAEAARHDAVCRHLGIMTPEEVKNVRVRHGLSRQAFASITRLGEASIARWEAGSHFPNRAYDSFLYLLCYEDNFRRLKNRHAIVVTEKGHTELAEESKFHLRLVKRTPKLALEQGAFELRPSQMSVQIT